MNADGTGQTRITPFADVNTQDPAWSPNGSKIAFTRNPHDDDGNVEIYVINADGTGQTNLTNNPALDITAAWSPDGSKLAFVSSRDGNNEIYVMNADGTDQTRLTNNSAADQEPAWTPTPAVTPF